MNGVADLTVRAARSSEADRVGQFYKSNSDVGVRPRPDTIIEKALENGRIHIVEDANGRIVGAAANFEYLDGRYLELGAVRVIVNGFGLQQILNWCLSITDSIYDIAASVPQPLGGENDDAVTGRTFFAIVEKGTASHSSQLRVGYIEWEPSQVLRDERERVLGPWAEKKLCLRLPPTALAGHAEKLLALWERPLLGRSARLAETPGPAQVRLRLNLPFLATAQRRNAVRILAGLPPLVSSDNLDQGSKQE